MQKGGKQQCNRRCRKASRDVRGDEATARPHTCAENTQQQEAETKEKEGPTTGIQRILTRQGEKQNIMRFNRPGAQCSTGSL